MPDEVYSQASAQFNEAELIALTLSVLEINGWNRFCVSFNRVPGDYTVGQHAA